MVASRRTLSGAGELRLVIAGTFLHASPERMTPRGGAGLLPSCEGTAGFARAGVRCRTATDSTVPAAADPGSPRNNRPTRLMTENRLIPSFPPALNPAEPIPWVCCPAIRPPAPDAYRIAAAEPPSRTLAPPNAGTVMPLVWRRSDTQRYTSGALILRQSYHRSDAGQTPVSGAARLTKGGRPPTRQAPTPQRFVIAGRRRWMRIAALSRT